MKEGKRKKKKKRGKPFAGKDGRKTKTIEEGARVEGRNMESRVVKGTISVLILFLVFSPFFI